MTEREIQAALYCDIVNRGHRYIVPNSGVFGWEADMISCTRAGYINEWEIKISRSDFLADMKKIKGNYILRTHISLDFCLGVRYIRV